MERNERLKAANKCASRYTNENEARIARKAFMLGCEFEAQGEVVKGVVLDTLQEPDGLHFLPMVRLVEMIRTDEWNDRGKRYAEKLVSALENEGYPTDARLVRNHIKYMDGENVPMATMDKQESEVDCFKIKGWVAREPNFILMLFTAKPERFGEMWEVMAGEEMPINSSLFPDIRWEDDPIEVELLIKKI